MDIGIDVGTGFTKIASNGRCQMFPSLYSCMYTDGRKEIEDKAGKNVLQEAVGKDALRMGTEDKAILLRPVKHGVPHNERGYEALVRQALKVIGASNPAEAKIIIGIPNDARDGIKKIERMMASRIRPASYTILPQAYGTLKYCGRKEGTVVNIGHGTTEIFTKTPNQIKGSSIRKASDFVMSQLDETRGSYVDYEKIFENNRSMTAKLAKLLAEHIADEVVKIGADREVILAGGGALIPGVRESLEGMIGMPAFVPDDPVYSNAKGLEMFAKSGSTQAAATKTYRPGPGTQPGSTKTQEGAKSGEGRLGQSSQNAQDPRQVMQVPA